MAHGFRYVPKQRTARDVSRHYECCGALTGLGNDSPHLCKEVTPPGTILAPTAMIPFTPARLPETGAT